MADGPVALVGSGEFLPVMEEVDRGLLAGRAPRAVILPTAAGEEGPTSTTRWLKKGEAHYERLGVEPVPLPVVDRETADDPELAHRIEGAGLVYLSGGNPGYLARTLRGTAVWQAIVVAWHGGAALAGCSAGAAALSAVVHDVRAKGYPAAPGLGVVPHLAVVPHFDRIGRFFKGLAEKMVADAGPGVTVVGVDEKTALVGGPEDWTVQGEQSVWVLHADGHRDRYAAGQPIRLPPTA